MPFRLAKIFLGEIPLEAWFDIEQKTPNSRKNYVINIKIDEKTKSIFGNLRGDEPLAFHGELIDSEEEFFLSVITPNQYLFINK
ncbi:hypothetical protein [Erwinia sp. JUb26]|uniref:hypothetical protein n=1 Tax=Erwinia sp. JUb26 TaxID=2485126 RepID=UPI000F47C139|nr:hypothetical protein [Erwinia sp. JUb26]ROR14941.1 hypothetical protein EC836_101441 [Erwinia sp. JUb26]